MNNCERGRGRLLDQGTSSWRILQLSEGQGWSADPSTCHLGRMSVHDLNGHLDSALSEVHPLA